MVGALFSWVADWQGRRLPIFVGCLGVCVGTVVTSVAPTIPVFVGGRFLLSFFSTLATMSSPLYLIEIAAPQYRGTIAGLYNTLYYLVCHPSVPDICRKSNVFQGIYNRDGRCIWGTSKPCRSWKLGLETTIMAPDAMPWHCCFRNLVLSRVTAMVCTRDF